MNPYRDPDCGMPFAKQPLEALPVARVTEALCKLGEMQERQCGVATFIGGDVLGWFSAFADICLGIDVALIDQDGCELHGRTMGERCVSSSCFHPITLARMTENPMSSG